jgi:predicted nucleic acid-binding protein
VIVYPDSSFVLSLNVEDDVNHVAASKLASRYAADDWLWCDLHAVELFCTVRSSIHRDRAALPQPTARAVIFRLEREVRRGYFQRRELPLADSVARALALSEAHGWERAHTPFDIWHVAAAWCFAADRFATFDERQAELAEEAGLLLA